MRRLKMNLPERAGLLHLLAAVDVLALLAVFALAGSVAPQRNGLEIELPGSEFQLRPLDKAIILTARGRENPVLALGRTPILLENLGKELRKQKEQKSAETVLLKTDASLSVAVERRLIEESLKAGLKCVVLGK